jgi:hypothetical protein
MMRMRRKTWLIDTMHNIIHWSTGENETAYHVGSNCEGTNTIGLRSDIDVLSCLHYISIMQDWSDWELAR